MTPEARAKHTAYMRDWRARHPERWRAISSASHKRWRERYPERAKLLRRISKMNTRARTVGAEGSITIAALAAAIAASGGRCTYCRAETVEIDHRTPLCRGGSNTADNIHVVCRPCNLSKGRKTEPEFLGLAMPHCGRGHPYTPENRLPNSVCRPCAAISSRASYLRTAAAAQARVVARRASDPEFRERSRGYQRAYFERHKADPGFMERRREQTRAWRRRQAAA